MLFPYWGVQIKPLLICLHSKAFRYAKKNMHNCASAKVAILDSFENMSDLVALIWNVMQTDSDCW